MSQYTGRRYNGFQPFSVVKSKGGGRFSQERSRPGNGSGNPGEVSLPVSGSPRNTRPPMVVAMQWVSQITTISFEMVLPALLGYWLDSRWGTDPWLLIGGAVLGFAVGMMHLWQLLKPKTNQRQKPGNSGQSTHNSHKKD